MNTIKKLALAKSRVSRAACVTTVIRLSSLFLFFRYYTQNSQQILVHFMTTVSFCFHRTQLCSCAHNDLQKTNKQICQSFAQLPAQAWRDVGTVERHSRGQNPANLHWYSCFTHLQTKLQMRQKQKHLKTDLKYKIYTYAF